MLTPYDRRNQIQERALHALTEGDHYYLLWRTSRDENEWDSACSAWGDGLRHLDLISNLKPQGSDIDPRCGA